MSHEHESSFSVGVQAWHGLAKVLDDAPSCSDAIIQAGLDWNVILQELSYTWNGQTVLSGDFAVIRESDGRKLGTVGARFEPLQNIEAFNFLDPLVSSGKIILETAGSLQKGEIVWILGKIQSDEVKPGDRIDSYFLFAQGHGGNLRIIGQKTDIRVVCMNTLSAALDPDLVGDKRTGRKAKSHKKGIGFSLKHTSTAKSKLERAQKALMEAFAVHDDEMAIYRKMANTSMSEKQLDGYLKSIFAKTLDETQKKMEIEDVVSSMFLKNSQVEESRDVVSDLLKGSAQEEESRDLVAEMLAEVPEEIKVPRAVEKCREAYFQAPGADPGTVWGGYNAVTYYLDHQYGRSADSRIHNSWFGKGKDVRQDAFDKALTLIK